MSMSSLSMSELITFIASITSAAGVFFKLSVKLSVLEAKVEVSQKWQDEHKEKQEKMIMRIEEKLDKMYEQISALSHPKEQTRQTRKTQ